MPFAKGTPKPPGSGRQPGQVGPGKKLKAKIQMIQLSRDVQNRLEELGCDPIKIMAEIASDEKEDRSLRLRAASEVAQYVWPKRKAVEHSGPNGGPINVASSAKDALEARIDGIRQRLRDSGLLIDA